MIKAHTYDTQPHSVASRVLTRQHGGGSPTMWQAVFSQGNTTKHLQAYCAAVDVKKELY